MSVAGIEPQYGVWSWITTIDHKRIGILYGVSALSSFLVGGLEALLIRRPALAPNNDIVSASTYNELFTMHGTTMIFLALMPLSDRLLQLHRAAPDRRARCRLPAAERLQLLDLPGRRASSST